MPSAADYFTDRHSDYPGQGMQTSAYGATGKGGR